MLEVSAGTTSSISSFEYDHNKFPSFERLVKFLDKNAQQNKISSGVLEIRLSNSLLFRYATGYTDCSKEKPIPYNCIFPVYSLSKFATTILTLFFIENGELSLHDSITDYLPFFSDQRVLTKADDLSETVSLTHPIQIKDLLLHTSGISFGQCSPLGRTMHEERQLDFYRLNQPNLTLKQLANEIANLPLAFQPGTSWAYGWSSDILGLILESLHGIKLEILFDKYLFSPLNMHDTHFVVPPDKASRLCQPESDEKKYGGEVIRSVLSKPRFYSCGEGISTTSADWMKLLNVFNKESYTGFPQILTAAAKQLVIRDQIGELANRPKFPLFPNYTFGMGCAVKKEDSKPKSPGNSGEITWWSKYGSAFWFDPFNSLAGVWLTNKPDEARYFPESIKSLVHQALAAEIDASFMYK